MAKLDSANVSRETFAASPKELLEFLRWALNVWATILVGDFEKLESSSAHLRRRRTRLIATEFLCALIGLVSGFVGAMTGVGSALLAVPMLLTAPTLLNLPPLAVHATTGLAMVQGLTTNLVGALVHKRAGFVSGFLLWWMGSSVIFGSLLGSVASRWLPERWLLLMLGFVLLFCAFQMLRPTPELESDFVPNKPFHFAAAGFATGILAGATGLGIGSLTIALLVYWLKVPVRIAIGSTLGISLLSAITGTMGKALTLQVPPVEAFGLGVGAAVGALWGSRVSHKVPVKTLRKILAAFIAIAAFHSLYRYFG